jgi:hypothetical protein
MVTTPTNLTPAPGTGSFMVSEANGYRSREQIRIGKGAGKLQAGTVLARLTADVGNAKAGEFVPYVAGGASGAGAFGAICYEQVDATAAAVSVTGIVRDAEVQRSALAFAGTPSAPDMAAAFAGMSVLGITLR